MIKAVTVTNFLQKSLRIELTNPWDSGFNIKNIDGIGPAKASINSTDTIGDGTVYNSSRLGARNIVMDIEFLGTDIEALRHKSYKFFPVKKPVTLVFETDSRVVEATGYVESNVPNIFSERENTQVSIICNDPMFYAYGEKAVTSTPFSSVTPRFEFPFSNESTTEPLLELSSVDLFQSGVIIYSGEAEVGMQIHIHAIGPATNVTIFNLNTNEQISIDTAVLTQITGSAILAGDDIFITTTHGSKSVILSRDGSFYNILNVVGKTPDWLTLVPGDNVFAYTAETGSTNLQFEFKNNTLYEGV